MPYVSKLDVMILLLAGLAASILNQKTLRELEILLEVNARTNGEKKTQSAEDIRKLIEPSPLGLRIETSGVKASIDSENEGSEWGDDDWIIFTPRPGNQETVFPVTYDKSRATIRVRGRDLTDHAIECENLPSACACDSISLTNRGVVVKHAADKARVCTWKFELADK